ncbi:UDP-N-acetylglucosamine 2-epimerase [Thalassotalea piscium]
MKKIAVFTGTRADYGLLYLLLKGLQTSNEIELQLLVGGTHLLDEFGHTIDHIIKDDLKITEQLDYLVHDDTNLAVNNSMAKAQELAGECLVKHQPDLLILLGDRFEALAVAQAATICRVPIAHIHGGEITEGAIDDVFRHAITKLSHWHFTSTEAYRQRVIQLGEQPNTVFNVGAPGIDNIKQLPLLNVKQLAKTLKINLEKPYFLVTYHPETLTTQSPVKALKHLLAAIDKFPHYQVIITYPNADTQGRIIMTGLEAYAKEQPERIHLFRSIGQLNYLSAMKYCDVVIGNSSSGIIEAPSFNVPTVNIGQRQQGRIASKSVIQTKSDENNIYLSIEKALSPKFRVNIADLSNPYGEGNACKAILERIIKMPLPKLHKTFYDIEKSMDGPFKGECHD